MATSFRDWPWPLQALLYVGLTIVLVLAGFYVPGSPWPVRTVGPLQDRARMMGF